MRLVAAGAFCLLLVTAAQASPAGAGTEGPSFNCAHVTSQVNRTICASPELSALDRKLASDFNNARYQGGSDGKALEAEEAAWLRDMRNRCADADCIRKAYEERDAKVLDESLHAASPAAYEETRPFAAPAATLAAARALVGRPCADHSEDLPPGAGFVAKNVYQPVISAGTVVLPRTKDGAWFAFLLDTRNNACRIADVVALPGPKEADAFLACYVPPDDGTANYQSSGFGMRRSGHKALAGYWEVDSKAATMTRQPLGVLGWDGKIKCNYPETGE
jgi:uncharacterized protein YecT (DUF1311 family)